MANVHPDTVDVFFNESKAAAGELADSLKGFRSNVITVLAVATGAATFFGFDKSTKGVLYVLALIAYGLAALAAVPVLWPKDWMTNPASDFKAALTSQPSMNKTKAQYDLADAYQKVWRNNLQVLHWVAIWFRIATVLAASVVVLAGVNSTVRHPAVPDKATHIVIDREG